MYEKPVIKNPQYPMMERMLLVTGSSQAHQQQLLLMLMAMLQHVNLMSRRSG